MGRRPDATGVRPLVVVGLSSEPSDGERARRQRDFTTPREGEPHGGAQDFLTFIEEVVKPWVAGRAVIDPLRQTLFGHSLGGYFALWVLTRKPAAFRSYAAVSPSIWWDRQGLLQASTQLKPQAARVLLAMGEWEEALPPWQTGAAESASALARRRERQTTAAARELGVHLASRLSKDAVHFQILADEDHASVVSAAIPRALRLASSS